MLRQQLAGEAEERDTAKRSLKRLGRTLEVYRQRLSALVGSDPGLSGPVGLGISQRARELVRSMEADLLQGGRADAEVGPHATEALAALPGSPRPVRSCEVLRQSLEEAQRRCKSLSSDMVQQTQTNEELVEALGSVKDANKRLLGQIRFQTDEISQLTQQRITDEERLDHITQKHRADQEAYRLDLHGRLSALRDSSGGQHRSLQVRLSDKLRSFRTRAEMIGQDTMWTLEQQRQLRKDAVTLVESFQVHMQAASRDVAARCNGLVEEHARQRQAIEDSISALEAQLAAEREASQNEGLTWGHKHSLLSADAEDVQSRLARDVAQLTSQLQALERFAAAERQAWAEESSALQGHIEAASSEQAARREELEHLQRNISRLEAAALGAEAEARAKEQAAEDLRRQVGEGEDALGAAASGNEHLQRQLEEQRKRFEEKNALDLADAKSSHERRLGDATQSQEANADLGARQLRALDDQLREEEDSVRSVRAQLSALEAECDSLEQDIAGHRSLHDAAKGERQGFEKELAEARQSAALERLRLQAEGDRLTSGAAAAGEDVQRMEVHLGEFRRVAGARDADHSARRAAAEATQQDLQEQLAELRRKLLDSSEARVRAEQDAAVVRRRALEEEAALERSVDEAKRGSQELRRRLTDALMEEERGVAQAKKDFENERESGLAMLKRAQDESRSKLGLAETNRARLQENCRADVAEANDLVAQQQRRCDSLEQEVSAARRQLAESEANLGWVREEFDRDDRETSLALRQLGEDARSVKAALEKAVREEASLSRQIEEATQRQAQEQKRLARELEGVRASSMKEVVELDDRLQQARADVALLELQGPASIDRSREEVLLERENSRLRSLLSEQGRSSAGLNTLHSKLENHIQRLQRHTEELRSSLHGSAGAATAVTPGRQRRSLGGAGAAPRLAEPVTVQMREAEDGPSMLGQSILSGGG